MSAPERIWVRAHEAFDEDPCFPPSFGDVPQYVRADLAEPPWIPTLLTALGWQGGTIHQALDEVRRLKAAETELRGKINGYIGAAEGTMKGIQTGKVTHAQIRFLLECALDSLSAFRASAEPAPDHKETTE